MSNLYNALGPWPEPKEGEPKTEPREDSAAQPGQRLISPDESSVLRSLLKTESRAKALLAQIAAERAELQNRWCAAQDQHGLARHTTDIFIQDLRRRGIEIPEEDLHSDTERA